MLLFFSDRLQCENYYCAFYPLKCTTSKGPVFLVALTAHHIQTLMSGSDTSWITVRNVLFQDFL